MEQIIEALLYCKALLTLVDQHKYSSVTMALEQARRLQWHKITRDPATWPEPGKWVTMKRGDHYYTYVFRCNDYGELVADTCMLLVKPTDFEAWCYVCEWSEK